MSALKARRQQLSLQWHWRKARGEVLCWAEITSERGEFGAQFLQQAFGRGEGALVCFLLIFL